MKALVLAGGFPQIALIKELKERGAEVILADYNTNPVAKKYADKYYQTSTLDIEAIRNIAMDEKVDFLITVCTDQALHTVAKVSEDLGLPCYIDYKTALNVTNKQYMKAVFVKSGIPTAKHYIMETLDEKKISSLRFPLIVKPVDCNSSKGVRKCENLEQLQHYFKDAVEFSRTKTAVVEEFIEGSEISVDVYVDNGIAHVLSASTSDKIADKDKFVIFRSIWPAAMSESVAKEIEIIAQQIADSFNIKNSPMLIQLLSDGTHAYVVEFSARTGGGVKYILIKHASGFDVIKAVVDLTLGNKPDCKVIRPKNKYLVNDFIYCKAGVFDHLEGFEELKSEGIIDNYYLFKWKGASFDSIKSSGDRVAGYTVTAETAQELLRKHSVVNGRIKAISVKGDDMIRHDLLTGLYIRDGFVFSKK